jgi:hypothetical protein
LLGLPWVIAHQRLQVYELTIVRLIALIVYCEPGFISCEQVATKSQLDVGEMRLQCIGAHNDRIGALDELIAGLARDDATIDDTTHRSDNQQNGDCTDQDFGTNGGVVEPASHRLQSRSVRFLSPLESIAIPNRIHVQLDHYFITEA